MFYRNLEKKKELTSATFTDKSAVARQSEKADKEMNISSSSFFSLPLFAFAYVRAAWLTARPSKS